MTPAQEHSIRETFIASNQGHIHFGEVVGKLVQAGVESYQVDYRSNQSIYHNHQDEALILTTTASEQTIAQEFSAEKIVTAIRGAQLGTVMYPEFKRLSKEAGCVGYTVWIAGRQVTYFGRKGETHVERFPD